MPNLDAKMIIIDVLNKPYSAPPLEFEEATGLTGLHTPWKMPKNAKHSVIERPFLLSLLARSNTITQLFDQILELNPDLSTFRDLRSDLKRSGDIVHGAISQFNLDDIRYFIERSFQPRDTNFQGVYDDYLYERSTRSDERNKQIDQIFREDAQYNRLRNLVSLRANRSIDWLASKSTLNKMWDQMNAHPSYADLAVDFSKASEIMLHSFPFTFCSNTAIDDNFVDIYLHDNQSRRERNETEMVWLKRAHGPAPVYPWERLLSHRNTPPKP